MPGQGSFFYFLLWPGSWAWAGYAGFIEKAESLMIHKVIIPLYCEEVAPRFDLASETFIATISGKKVEEKKYMVLKRPSAEDLCHFILTENINTLICNAIDDEYCHFLKWKKVLIIDNVAGTLADAFDNYLNNTLKSGDILCSRTIEGEHV